MMKITPASDVDHCSE